MNGIGSKNKYDDYEDDADIMEAIIDSLRITEEQNKFNSKITTLKHESNTKYENESKENNKIKRQLKIENERRL